MSLKSIVKFGLNYISTAATTTRRIDTISKTIKDVSRRPKKSAGTVKSVCGNGDIMVCGDCGGEIVQVKTNGRKACFKCGKEVK